MTREMKAWLDDQIRKAGQAHALTSNREAQAAWSARLVALAQVRAQVWKI